MLTPWRISVTATLGWYLREQLTLHGKVAYRLCRCPSRGANGIQCERWLHARGEHR